MNNKLLEKIFSISLKARILREWQKSNRADDQQFTERELLTLELISDFAPITEKALAKIFGLAFSSVSDLVRGLKELDFIDSSDKIRGQPLALTPKGRAALEKLKQVSATRFTYLMESLDESDLQALMRVFDKMDRNAGATVQKFVFDRYDAEELPPSAASPTRGQ